MEKLTIFLKINPKKIYTYLPKKGQPHLYPRTTLFFVNPKPPTQENDLFLQKFLFAFINYSILDV